MHRASAGGHLICGPCSAAAAGELAISPVPPIGHCSILRGMAEPVDRFDELQLLRVDRTGRVATITIAGRRSTCSMDRCLRS